MVISLFKQDQKWNLFRYIIYLQQSDSALCKLSLLRIYRIFFFLHCKSHIGTTANPISSLYLKNIVISALFPAYFCLVQVEERQKQEDKLQHSPWRQRQTDHDVSSAGILTNLSIQSTITLGRAGVSSVSRLRYIATLSCVIAFVIFDTRTRYFHTISGTPTI